MQYYAIFIYVKLQCKMLFFFYKQNQNPNTRFVIITKLLMKSHIKNWFILLGFEDVQRKTINFLQNYFLFE